MSHSRKHVKASVLQDCPEITTDEEKLAKVVELRGRPVIQLIFSHLSRSEHLSSRIP